MRFCAFLFAVLVCAPSAVIGATDSSQVRLGVFGGYGLNTHRADFMRLPDCPSCSPGFRDGKGAGISFGVVGDLRIGSDFFLSSKLTYNVLSGELIQAESTTIIVNATPQEGEFTHYLQSTLSTIGIEPHVKYNPVGHLFVNVGFNLSTFLVTRYSQVEKITKPTAQGTFLDENGFDTFSRERNRFEGTLQKPNAIYFAPFVSLSYQLPLNADGTFVVEPELGYMYGLTNVVNDDLVSQWNVDRLSAGVSIKYRLSEQQRKREIRQIEFRVDTVEIVNALFDEDQFLFGRESTDIDTIEAETEIVIIETTARTDTLFIAPPKRLDVSVVVVGVNAAGLEVDEPVIARTVAPSTRLDPMLNMVFFEDNSADLPSRYTTLTKSEAGDFNVDELSNVSTLQVYYNVLNIIGWRMTQHPTAKITLVGFNSNAGSEAYNTELAVARAMAVKEYLVGVWGLNQSRVAIQASDKIWAPSTPISAQDKTAEYRRVEIYSDDSRIVESVFVEQVKPSATPPKIRFKLKDTSNVKIKRWKLTSFLQSSPDVSFTVSGDSTLAPYLDWSLSNNERYSPTNGSVLKTQLDVVDERGAVTEIAGNDLVIGHEDNTPSKKRQLVADTIVETYSLILLDDGQVVIEGENERIVQIIKSRVKEHSVIEILGYADRTGTKEYNLKLAERRCSLVKDAIGRGDANVVALGSSTLLYNNEFPEGRFYCRTAIIIVKTRSQL